MAKTLAQFSHHRYHADLTALAVMCSFVRLRRLIESREKLAEQLLDLEQRHEQKFQIVFDAIKELTKDKQVPHKRRIGLGIQET